MAIGHVAIIGAGIGGLAAAIAARRAGLKASVFEQAPRIEPLGASVTLWPNAVGCLRSLGVAEKVLSKGAAVRTSEVRSINGRVLVHVPMQPLYDEAGEIGICITRADLQGALLDELGADTVTLNCRLRSFASNAAHVELDFEDSRRSQADLVIGADGLRSTARQQLFGDGPPRYAGYGAWLGLAEIEHPELKREFGCEIYGAGERFGVIDTGRGKYYWYFVENRSVPSEKVEAGDPAVLLSKLHDWPIFTRALVEGTDSRKIQFVSFFDRSARNVWGNGRVLLLGDAIHPYVPNLGQGACQAIEDAYVLGHAFRKGLTPVELLSYYQSARVERAAMFGRDSIRMGKAAQVTNPFLRWFRDNVLRLVPGSVHAKQLKTHFALPTLS
jgi:FAD-dependent urate hydroxylase